MINCGGVKLRLELTGGRQAAGREVGDGGVLAFTEGRAVEGGGVSVP